MNFNKKDHISKYEFAASKIVSYFKKKGVEFTPVDETGENVIFASANKTIKISHHSFYRFSGIAVIYKEEKDNSITVIEVTNEMYMNDFMKPIIELLLMP